MISCTCYYCAERRTLSLPPRKSLKRYRRNPNGPSIDARLREAEREYIDFPNRETWGKYNWLRRQAGLPEIPIPKEKGTINVLLGFWLTATLGKKTKLRRNPTCSWISKAHRASRKQCDKPANGMGLCNQHYETIKRKEEMRPFLEMKRRFARRPSMVYRRNADLSQRQLERSNDPDDQAKLIGIKVRAGEISEENVLLAAYLYDPAALMYTEGAVWDSSIIPPDTYEGDARLRIILRHAGLDKQFVVRCAIDFARRVLHIWERWDPDDTRFSEAIAAAEHWLEVRNDAAAIAADTAAENAIAVREEIDPGLDEAWNAIAAAAAAANAAAYPHTVNDYGNYAAQASRDAQEAAHDGDAELTWQTRRVINYLLNRSQPPNVGSALKRRRNPEDLERLEKIARAWTLYQKYKNISKVAKEMGVGDTTITRWLNLPRTKTKEITAQRVEKARELFQQGHSQSAIAREMGVSQTAIHQYYKRGLLGEKPEDPRAAKVRKMYLQGMKKTHIARDLKVKNKTIDKWLEGLEDPRKTKARELFQRGEGISSIRKILGIDYSKLRKWVDEFQQRHNPKLRRNADEPLRKSEREVLRGGGKYAYYRQLMRTNQPIPSIVKAHKKLMRAIQLFPMARTGAMHRKIPKKPKPAIQRPEEAIEYILPTDGVDKEVIDASVLGQTPTATLLAALAEIIDRSNVMIGPNRPAGGNEITGFGEVYYGNYMMVAKAAKNLAKAAAEIRFTFIDGEKDAIWGLATALLQQIIALIPPLDETASRSAQILHTTMGHIAKSLTLRIHNDFSNKIISKSRINHISSNISALAGWMHGASSNTAIRLRVLNRRWEYLISPLLLLANKL